MPSETRYYRNDTHLINGITARKLITTQGTSYDNNVYTIYTVSGFNFYFRYSVTRRQSNGTETTLGLDIASTTRYTGDGDAEGEQTGTWSCPQTALVSTDAIIINSEIYEDFGNSTGGFNYFITEQLGATQLDAAVWSFTRYTLVYIEPDVFASGAIYYGSSTYNTRITNFTWSAGGVVGAGGALILTDNEMRRGRLVV